jgi:ribosomal protein L14
MIQMRTILEVADNSGRQAHLLHRHPGRLQGKYAELGDIITANVKEADPTAP